MFPKTIDIIIHVKENIYKIVYTQKKTFNTLIQDFISYFIYFLFWSISHWSDPSNLTPIVDNYLLYGHN